MNDRVVKRSKTEGSASPRFLFAQLLRKTSFREKWAEKQNYPSSGISPPMFRLWYARTPVELIYLGQVLALRSEAASARCSSTLLWLRHGFPEAVRMRSKSGADRSAKDPICKSGTDRLPGWCFYCPLLRKVMLMTGQHALTLKAHFDGS